MNIEGKLIVVSGPSCVGKSPMLKTLRTAYPELTSRMQSVVLYNDRKPRPGETDGVDYHFRERSYIESLKDDSEFVVNNVRGDWQALDITELLQALKTKDMIYEGNPYFGVILLSDKRLIGIPKLSIFISPLAQKEYTLMIATFGYEETSRLIYRMMKRKLVRRTMNHKQSISDDDRPAIDLRASSAHQEILMAGRFDYVIANHDGEDSDHWFDYGIPLGDAKRTVQAMAALLKGEVTDLAGKWV